MQKVTGLNRFHLPAYIICLLSSLDMEPQGHRHEVKWSHGQDQSQASYSKYKSLRGKFILKIYESHSLQPLLSIHMLHAYAHLCNGSSSMQIYVKKLINISYTLMAVTHFKDFLPSEEQNKCKGKYYHDACFITEQTAETISNKQSPAKKSDNFPLLTQCFFSSLSQIAFSNVDVVPCIFFHPQATGQGKVHLPRDLGKRYLYDAVNAEIQKTDVYKGSHPLAQEEMHLSEFRLLFFSTLWVKVLTIKLWF